jgi:L-iditol 2-dehydrogenase
MKTMEMTALGRIEPGSAEIPAIGEKDLLVRIKCVGICGSDVHYFHDGRIADYVVEPPFMLGHECAGVVEKVGAGVTRFRPGDRVALEPGIPCGECEFCREGKYNLCPDVIFFATPPVQGCLCEYVAFPESMAFALPDSLSFEEGALLEPLAVGFHAALQGGARVGQTAAVLGSGCIGLTTLLALKSMGVSTVFVTDVLANRLETAKALGGIPVNARETDPVAAILEAIGGQGVDLVLEASGSERATLQTAELVKRGGTVVLIGMAAQGVMPYNIGLLMGKEATIKTVFRYRNIYPLAIDAVASGVAPVGRLVSHRYGFDESQKAFEEAVEKKAEIVKGVILL